jgi:hypothetical protein
MIAECILNEAQVPRLRTDLEARLDYSLIVGVAWTEHHSVLAKGDGLPVAIGRDVADGQRWHGVFARRACMIRTNSSSAGGSGISSRGRLARSITLTNARRPNTLRTDRARSIIFPIAIGQYIIHIPSTWMVYEGRQ